MILKFSHIKREDIFVSEFNSFSENNEIDFAKSIAVIYGPNGTGKTSLAKVLSNHTETEYIADIDGTEVRTGDNEFFHVIDDQHGRNIIQGTEEEFLLGDGIAKEYRLQRYLNDKFELCFSSEIAGRLKNEFSISKKDSRLISYITDSYLSSCILRFANMKDRGRELNRDEFVAYVKKMNVCAVDLHDEDKYKFFIEDMDQKNSLIQKIEQLSSIKIIACPQITKVEENNEALNLLDKYRHKDECIVCDNQIDPIKLIESKTNMNKIILKGMDKDSKQIIENIISKIKQPDVFKIKETLEKSIEIGDVSIANALICEFEVYRNVFNQKINNLFCEVIKTKDLIEKQEEYKKLIEGKAEFSDEDILFIEKVVNENIDKKIALERDSNKNLKLTLNGEQFINKDRANLKLSTGEQNFISLAFELLRAKNVEAKIIVIDDPISSFDSIYKNKIAFSLIKFLEDKKQIILTHNTELIRLLEHQKQSSFKMYLFNNTIGEENGFIAISDEEKQILLYLDKLLALFRSEIINEIKDTKLFLIAMIPFARGYSQITASPLKNNFTKLMHGYNTDIEDICDLYNQLFGNGNTLISGKIFVSAKDIANIDISNIQILKNTTKYPLLDKTLRHTLTYLHLRLNVEKTLVEKIWYKYFEIRFTCKYNYASI